MNVTMEFFTGGVRRFWLIAALLVLGAVSLSADSLADAQARMKERLPEVDQLKREQLVGENNRGFLEERTPLSQERKTLVREENEDRKIIYEHVARQNRTTGEQVGRVRARQIAERSARGVLIQKEDGQWEEKR